MKRHLYIYILKLNNSNLSKFACSILAKYILKCDLRNLLTPCRATNTTRHWFGGIVRLNKYTIWILHNLSLSCDLNIRTSQYRRLNLIWFVFYIQSTGKEKIFNIYSEGVRIISILCETLFVDVYFYLSWKSKPPMQTLHRYMASIRKTLSRSLGKRSLTNINIRDDLKLLPSRNWYERMIVKSTQ